MRRANGLGARPRECGESSAPLMEEVCDNIARHGWAVMIKVIRDGTMQRDGGDIFWLRMVVLDTYRSSSRMFELFGLFLGRFTLHFTLFLHYV